MKSLIHPKELLSNITKAKVQNSHNLTPSKNCDIQPAHEVGVFASHRDVLVAIEELLEAGFSLEGIALVARQAKHHDWQEDFTIYDNFDEELFGSNEIDRYFFLRLFERGKYLLLVTGTEQDLKSIGAIIGRRRGHGEVWYF